MRLPRSRKKPLRATVAVALALACANASAQSVNSERVSVYENALLEVLAAQCRMTSWDEAFAEAKNRSTSLHIALADVKQAEGAIRTSLGSLLPQLSLSGTAGYSGILRSSPAGALGVNLVASQSVVDLASWQSLDAVRSDADATRLQAEDVRRQLALALANAVFGVMTAERIAAINRDGLTQAMERLRLAQRRLELGGGTAIDSARAQQDAELALSLVVAGNEAYRRSRESLGLAIGRPEACDVATDMRIVSLDAVAQSCEQVDLMDRPDLASYRAAIRAATQRERAAWLGFLPTVSVDASLGHSVTWGDGTGISPWSIQAVLSVPLWDGGSRYGVIQANSARRVAAQEQLEALRRESVIDVVRAQRAVTVAEAALDASNAARNNAREVERLARSSFQQGLAESLELMTAASQLRSAEIDYVIKELQLVSARMYATLLVSRCA